MGTLPALCLDCVFDAGSLEESSPAFQNPHRRPEVGNDKMGHDFFNAFALTLEAQSS